MPGKMLTENQVTLYMNNRKDGETQVVSAARAGMSVRSGRNIEKNMRVRKKRNWKTRKDAFGKVRESDIVPMLKQGVYQATFILEELQKGYPEAYPNSILQTLQRRIKRWRALFGEAKEVIFRQVHEPGKLSISDFTHPKDIKVTINGKPLRHIFYHFRLQYSGFSYMQVFKGSGESFTIFAQGLQAALARIGGAPEVHRTDSLSASFKNVSKDDRTDLTERYKALAAHYNMKPTRINRGQSQENGGIESPHRHVKDRIRQSLIIRGSIDFTSFEMYQQFIAEVVNEHNKRLSKGLFEAEQAKLQPLPLTKGVEYTEIIAVVSRTSTIQVKRVMYSVPSRLINERLSVRVYHDRLECYLGTDHVIKLDRVYHAPGRKWNRSIDFRHLIKSLIKKPQAFRNSCLRNDILPNDNYKYIWNHVDKKMNNKLACKFIVGLLYLAAKENCEDELAEVVIEYISKKKKLCLKELQNRFTPKRETIPSIKVPQHSIKQYNELITNDQGVV